MTSPKISFIIPIYNTAIYLSECIESILTQRVELEIILVDDGSTDDSLTICLNYVKKYSFITLVHSQNKGQSAARNKAINLAQGKYIYLIEKQLSLGLKVIYKRKINEKTCYFRFNWFYR